MENLFFEKGYVVKSIDFSLIEEIRMDLKEKIIEKKEELSNKKCALLLRDLIYFTKLGMSLYDYVKQKYNVDIEILKEKETIDIDDLENYIFYIFSELNNKIEKNKNIFNLDILEDFDLSCSVYFYPLKEKTLLLVDTTQNEYVSIIEDHIYIEPYFFNMEMDVPPVGVSRLDWANRAKDWLYVINKCGGGVESWIPSAGGFKVELTENSMLMPDIKEVYQYLSEIQNIEFDNMLEGILGKN